MSGSPFPESSWNDVQARLRAVLPMLYELEPGGALAMELGSDGWILELTPDGRLICQTGVEMEDVQNLLSEGTPEDLGTDELAKQAKYYLQPAVAKFRKLLIGAGFEETTEMTDRYVAATFQKTVDFQKLDEAADAVRWCQEKMK